MDAQTLIQTSQPFLDYVTRWHADLAPAQLAQLTAEPERVAILSVDVINGFCHFGPLASPRVKSIIAPIVSLFERAHAAGVRNFVLTQDTHVPDAVEFAQYAPHCIRGTEESEAVPEFKALPFYDEMVTLPKNSISSTIHTGLEAWLQDHPRVDTFIVVGDCTDLCTYQLAMALRLRANALQLRQRVIVPEDCVDTYDLPVATAEQIGAMPHDADLLHLIFLYSMQLNGVEVVHSVQ